MPEAGAHIVVTGRVQGVGFREFTARTARGMNLTGFVRNLADGTVLAVVEGERTVVESLIDRLKEGPPSARVVDVLVSWLPATGRHDRFSIDF